MPRAWVIAFVLLSADAPADEIVLRGEAVRGTLALKDGRLELRGADGKARASGADLGIVTLTATSKTFRDGPPHVVTLPNDERVTGVFIGMEKETLTLRTAWANRLAVPRTALVALTHLPGWRTVVREEFAGKPTRLMRAEQAIEIHVSPKIGAGRVAVLFQEGERPASSRWAIEAVFATRTVRVTFAGDALSVDAGGLRGTAYPVKRSGEARKLTLTYSSGSMRLACDDEALWHSPDVGPGSLQQVRIVCLGADTKVNVSGLTVEVAEAVKRRPAGDPKRDELFLASGDQVFGDVGRIDVRGVEISGKFGTRSYAWKELRGWHPRRSEVVLGKKHEGVEVRLEIHSGMRAEPDVLRGALTALDAKKATLRHSILGELTIPRASIATLKPLTRP